jgi:hypothetical protein
MGRSSGLLGWASHLSRAVAAKSLCIDFAQGEDLLGIADETALRGDPIMTTMVSEAATIKSRAGVLVKEASDLIGAANVKMVAGHSLPDAKDAIHAAFEADHYAGMVLLHDLPRDRDLAERCYKQAKAYIAAAEKSLAAAKAALAKM